MKMTFVDIIDEVKLHSKYFASYFCILAIVFTATGNSEEYKQLFKNEYSTYYWFYKLYYTYFTCLITSVITECLALLTWSFVRYFKLKDEDLFKNSHYELLIIHIWCFFITFFGTAPSRTWKERFCLVCIILLPPIVFLSTVYQFTRLGLKSWIPQQLTSKPRLYPDTAPKPHPQMYGTIGRYQNSQPVQINVNKSLETQVCNPDTDEEVLRRRYSSCTLYPNIELPRPSHRDDNLSKASTMPLNLQLIPKNKQDSKKLHLRRLMDAAYPEDLTHARSLKQQKVEFFDQSSLHENWTDKTDSTLPVSKASMIPSKSQHLAKNEGDSKKLYLRCLACPEENDDCVQYRENCIRLMNEANLEGLKNERPLKQQKVGFLNLPPLDEKWIEKIESMKSTFSVTTSNFNQISDIRKEADAHTSGDCERITSATR